jgi:hypothetical protein
MTFREFQSLRREVIDLEPISGCDWHKGVPGFTYEVVIGAGLHIEKNNDAWKGTPAEPFAYMLVIANNDWLSNDLTELERKLYVFAIDEGYFPQG